MEISLNLGELVMMAMMVVCILGFWVGFWWASFLVQNRVTRQCRRLGGFYVGGLTFKCTEIADQDQE